MAQLRQDYDKFNALDAEVIIVGPDGPNAFRRFWENEHMPYIGLPDIKSKIADAFQQEVNLIKFGRMPALFIIDKKGIIRFNHYGNSMSDIPENQFVLDILKQVSVE